MKLTLEQFETKWAENNLSVTDWFDTTYGLFKELEALQSRSCDGCKHLYLNQYTEYVDYCTDLNIEIPHNNISTFYCNRYEPKDTH